MRIIKSINTANLSTVSIQGDLLTTAAIACFNRLKAKCSYCICQTRQEKTCSFSVRKVEVSMGAPSIFLIPPSLKALNPIRNFPVRAQMLLLGEKQSHLHTARSKYVNNASNYSNDFCHSWGSWAGNICIFFPNTLLEVKMQKCSMCSSLSLPGGVVSCWGIFQLLNSEGWLNILLFSWRPRSPISTWRLDLLWISAGIARAYLILRF